MRPKRCIVTRDGDDVNGKPICHVGGFKYMLCWIFMELKSKIESHFVTQWHINMTSHSCAGQLPMWYFLYQNGGGVAVPATNYLYEYITAITRTNDDRVHWRIIYVTRPQWVTGFNYSFMFYFVSSYIVSSSFISWHNGFFFNCETFPILL